MLAHRPHAALGTKFGGGADFSNITALQAIYNFNGTAEAVDFTLDLESRPGNRVPEPGTLLLVGLALSIGFAARRRRAEASLAAPHPGGGNFFGDVGFVDPTRARAASFWHD